MFGRKSPVPINTDAKGNAAQTQKELAGRYASLFMICYQRRDISGMHITLTAFTHTLHALQLWSAKKAIMEETKNYILVGGFPEVEVQALDWLLHHYFEQENSHDEDVLLNWYQSLDDEWILRKKLRALFPDKQNSELTVLIAAEQKKIGDK
jgi:hypothetical protein